MFNNLNNKLKPKPEIPLTINFLSGQSLEGTKLGKIISWVLSIGKIVVFITFAIVIGSFIYRLTLDQKIENLQEEIEENIEGINKNSVIENKIKITQTKLSGIKDIMNSSNDFNFALGQLEKSIPITVFLDKLSLGTSGIILSGISDNELSFSTFLSSLREKEEFSEIIVDEIVSGGVDNPEVTFSINLKLKKKEV